MIIRYEDWLPRLRVYLKSAESQSFSWVSNNCCSFAAGAIAAISDTNPMHQFHYLINDKVSAYQALKSYSGGGVLATAQAMARNLECPEVLPLQARRGDVVFMQTDAVDALGVVGVDGRFGMFMQPESGLGFHRLDECKCGWRIG